MELLDLTDDSLGYIFRFLPEEDIPRLRAVSRRIRDVAEARCKQIQKFDVSNCKRAIAEACTHLRWIRVDGTQFTDVSAFALSKCKELTHIHARDCPRITSAGVEALAKCPLILLDVFLNFADEWFGGPKFQKLEHSLTPEPILALAQCKQLQVLNIHRPFVDGMDGSLMNDALQTLFKSCTRLRSFVGGGDVNLTATTVDVLTRHCQQLVTLDIVHWPLVDDELILSIAVCLPGLQQLAISLDNRVATSSGVAQLAACEHLVSLRVKGTGGLGESAFDKIAEQCKELTSLQLDYYNGHSILCKYGRSDPLSLF